MQTKNKFPWGEGREWKGRTELIASHIKPESAVVDLGCGFCHLKKYIKDCQYVGVDIAEWVKGVRVADFNKKEFPVIGLFDFIICQGILEYIDEPRDFLKAIRKYGKNLIITYKEFSTTDIERRNIHSFQEIEEMLALNDWSIEEKKKYGSNQQIYICKKL